MALLALALAKLPAPVALRVSLPTQPDSVPALMVAAVLPLYGLLVTVLPATLSALGVMLAVAVAEPTV